MKSNAERDLKAVGQIKSQKLYDSNNSKKLKIPL